MSNRRSYAAGGLIPLSNDMQYVNAPKHERGGMMLPGGDEVEGGEVLQQAGYPTDPNERVFSEYMHIGNDPSQPSYAEMAAMIAQQKAIFEKELQQTVMKQQSLTLYMEKKSKPERSTIERDIEKLAARQLELQSQIQQLDVATDQLFNMQEAHAQQIGARDANGIPNQYADDIQGGYEGTGASGSDENSDEYGLLTEGDPTLLYQQSPHNQRYGGRRRYATGGTANLTHAGNRLYASNWQADVGDTGRGQVLGSALTGVGAGVASGAMTGAAIGSSLGPIGAVIGGVVGLGAGLVTGFSKRRKMREAEAERQELEHKQFLTNANNNIMVDQQRLRDFNETRQTVADADYYARTGGRVGLNIGRKYDTGGLKPIEGIHLPIVSRLGTLPALSIDRERLFRSNPTGAKPVSVNTGSNFYDRTGLTSQQGIGLAAGALSAIGQGVSNYFAYKDAKKLAPKAPLAMKFARMNTDIDVQDDINSVRSAYGKAAAAVNSGSSNAQVRRAHLKRLAAAQSEGESKVYQNRDNTRRTIERGNVQVENQERAYNNQMMNQYYDKQQAFNQGLLNMRTSIYNKGFSDLNNIIQSAGNAAQDNVYAELAIGDKDKQIQDILRNRIFYGKRKRA
jgi:hypothetical protein